MRSLDVDVRRCDMLEQLGGVEWSCQAEQSSAPGIALDGWRLGTGLPQAAQWCFALVKPSPVCGVRTSWEQVETE